MPPPLGAGGIVFSGCPSVRPSEAWNNLFSHVHGSVGPADQPWPFCGMSVRPSVRPSARRGYWAFAGERMEGMVWNSVCRCILGTFRTGWIMVMVCWFFSFKRHFDLVKRVKFWVPGHFPKKTWWRYFLLSEMGQIWGLRRFLGEPFEEMAWNFACWCILSIYRIDLILVIVCWFLAAIKQLYEWYFLSVCPSVRPSITPFWLCSHHRIIMKYSGVITNAQGKVRAKGQGQRSKFNVTEVTTQINCFRTVTPVWIHIWWWNVAYSFMLLRRGALLFFKVIRHISRSHGS